MSNDSISPAIAALIEAQAPRLQRARELIACVGLAEIKLRQDRDELLTLGWQLGEVLTAMKEDVGHGRWLAFLAGQLPKLTVRQAQLCMVFFADNPKCADSAHLTFTTDSVRKFLWHTIPEKERPQLEGDAPVAPITHHLTFVNTFEKWRRQLSLGRLGPKPAVDVLRRDCDPVVKNLAELLGRDYLIELLESLPATDAAAATA